MRIIVSMVLLWLWVGSVTAQDVDLQVESVEVVTRLDAYGLEQPFADGVIVNQSNDSYENVSLLAEVFDTSDALIGEGLGFLVNACGEALLADFTLAPNARQMFSLQLDLFIPDAEVGRVEIFPQGTTTEAAIGVEADTLPGITQVTEREVVALEWLDEQNLRYSSGCWRDVFSNRDWYDYNLANGTEAAITHPRVEALTEQMLGLIELTDPLLLNRSFLSFAPGGRRAAYQTRLNTLVTVEADGSFRRVLYDQLFNISLQGINWHKDSGTFLAYYHGGYGDDVLYLVANADGRQFSQPPAVSLPSRIVPGFAANGRGVVIAATIDDVTGYFLKATTTDFTLPMFEAEPPGNNWPAPFYEITDEGQRWIYIARPVDGQARLQCFNPDSQQLHDYTALPLDLNTDERGWLWLSPDNQTLALGANGVNGGLWLIDLTQFPECA